MTYHSWRTPTVAALSFMAGVIFTLTVQLNPSMVGFASAADESELLPPQAWRTADLNAMNLDVLPDIDWIPIESGTARNSETVIYEGENVVSVWDGGPAKLIIETPFPYDEFIVVLKGELILSDNAGNSATYKPGDMLMVPRGFIGSWYMTEEYRELVIIDTAAYYADPEP